MPDPAPRAGRDQFKIDPGSVTDFGVNDRDEGTMHVDTLGTGMSGLSFNDRDDEPEEKGPSPNKFSSYENTFDDREITGTGHYQIAEEEFDEVLGTLNRVATGRYEAEEIKEELPSKPE